MANYPAHGTQNWDVPLQDYIDDAVEQNAAGIELGYSERITDFATTATTPAVGVIPGLSIDIVGTGRPIDVEIVLPGVRHSVASTGVVAALAINGSTTVAGESQLCAVSSPSTTLGRTVVVRARLLPDLGEAVNLGCIVYGTAAGTTTVVGNSTVRNYISAVSR